MNKLKRRIEQWKTASKDMQIKVITGLIFRWHTFLCMHCKGLFNKIGSLLHDDQQRPCDTFELADNQMDCKLMLLSLSDDSMTIDGHVEKIGHIVQYILAKGHRNIKKL